MTLQSGDRVRTKVLQQGDKPDVWVTATVIGVNGDSESFNLAVDKEWHDRFASEALRVPPNLVEPIEEEPKSLISMINFPNQKASEAAKSPTRSPRGGGSSKYSVGQQVETRIVYGRKESEAKWIAAEIVEYNDDDDSWDLKVLKPKLHKVMKSAVHVPDVHVRPMPTAAPVDLANLPVVEVKQQDVDLCVGKGHAPRLAKLALQMSSGNLSFAENLLEAGRQKGRESDIRQGGVLHINVAKATSTKPISCVYMKLDGDVQVTDVQKQSTDHEFNCLMTWSDYSPNPKLELELWQHNRFRSNKCVGRKIVHAIGDLITESVDNARELNVELIDAKNKKVTGHVLIQILVQKTGMARIEI